jgi:hypothetical protein
MTARSPQQVQCRTHRVTRLPPMFTLTRPSESVERAEQVPGMRPTRYLPTAALIGAASLAPLAGIAGAQSPPAKSPPAQTAPAAPQVAMPGAETIVLLVRTTLLTLNDALQTGNFTVLRDMAAPGFREVNSAARLSIVFASLMQQGTDLAPVAILTPQLGEPPMIDAKTGMLRIKGSFPGQPGRLDFELIYQRVRDQWRPFGIAVQPAARPPGSAGSAPGSLPDSAGKLAPAKQPDQPKAAPKK